MIPEPRLKGLYQDVILDHNRKPRNFKEIANPTQYSHGVNPLCGDDYHLYLNVNPEGVIEDVGFKGAGCAISKSSASIMTTMVKGKKISEAGELAYHFLKLMTAEHATDEMKSAVGRMSLFEGVREFPVRVKCATLIWHALQDAIKDAGPAVETAVRG